MPDTLSDRLKTKSDDNTYPVVDCPACGQQDVPCVIDWYVFMGKMFTLCCHELVEKPVIKGWVSLVDLEDTGWDGEI